MVSYSKGRMQGKGTENRISRGICGPKTDENGELKILQDENLRVSYLI